MEEGENGGLVEMEEFAGLDIPPGQARMLVEKEEGSVLGFRGLA